MFKQIRQFFVRRRAVLEARILDVLAIHDELTCLGIADALKREYGYSSSFAALYPVLHGLEIRSLVTSRWGERTSERGYLRRRYYARVKFPP